MISLIQCSLCPIRSRLPNSYFCFCGAVCCRACLKDHRSEHLGQINLGAVAEFLGHDSYSLNLPPYEQSTQCDILGIMQSLRDRETGWS